MNFLQMNKLLAQIAVRNLGLYKMKTATIGGLLFFGTFLIVVGLTLLRNIEESMQASITKSVAAHVQVYSSKAKDPLALFGGSFMGREDVGKIENYADVKKVLEQSPLVEKTIPMGIETALIGRGNELDDAFDNLRAALKTRDSTEIDESIERAKQQISIVEEELRETLKITADKKETEEGLRLIGETKEPKFWQDLKADSEPKMLFLETKLAPLSGEKVPIYLRYLGTDFDLYPEMFSKFKIIEGEKVPSGTRGALVSHKFREEFLKNIAARLFDRLNKRLVINKNTLVADADARRFAADLARQHMAILVYLDKQESMQLAAELKEYLKQDLELTELIKTFLIVTDENFNERHKWFYEHIAPRIKLYELATGQTVVLRTYTRSGYVKSVPLNIFGVYSFDGLEDSDLAGGFTLIDLVSFRELYGQMDEASRKELEKLKQESQIQDVEQGNIEDALFGEDSSLVTEGSLSSSSSSLTSQQPLEAKAALSNTFDPEETQRGLVFNIGVLLKDEKEIPNAIEQFEKLFKENNLELKAVDWKTASGMVGQFVTIVRLVLLTGVGIIFLVALVIINNSMIVATLDRTREIGTIRAIGGQKSFVVSLFLWETLVIGFCGAALGTLGATALLLKLGADGIPAMHDVVVFLFSGPRLFPHLYVQTLLLSPLFVIFVAVVSSLFAARHAAEISPATAMQEKE